MIYTVYDPNTGKIEYNITGSSPESLALNLEGKTYIEGNYSDKHYYIVGGQAQPKEPDPSAGTLKYTFDDLTKEWVIDQQESERLARKHRNLLLNVVDKINPVWWASMTSEQQAEVQQFRQDLLDVPQQAGWPTAINWPTKPSFL